MRTFKESDEVYAQLKRFVVDPFDDTPEKVIGRLIEIVDKAKDRWCPFNEDEGAEEAEPRAETHAKRRPIPQEEPVVVL